MQFVASIKRVPLADLIPYARNSRTHSAAQIAQIADSMREFGFTNPILIDAKNGIIAGHGRVLAAQKLGLSDAPCIAMPHLTDAQKRAYIIADNKLALNAGWDDDLLRLELSELDGEGFDVTLTGFDADEISSLLCIEEGPAVKNVDVSSVSDQFWVSVQGPLQSQAAALSALKTVMAGIPGLTVELGTVRRDDE